MVKKLFALLVICIVAVAGLRRSEAEPDLGPDSYKVCFPGCKSDCLPKGSGPTFCEVKCDEECTAKEAAAKLALLDDSKS